MITKILKASRTFSTISLLVYSSQALSEPVPEGDIINNAETGAGTTVDCNQEIQTSEGPVTGFEKDKGEASACAWLGIPYAKPPVGELRWQKPHPPLPRDETLRANGYGPDCMQNRWLSDATIKTLATETSEDCLYLNIWKPKRANQNPEKGYPVMLWIHGGGLIIGSAAWPIYDGTRLVDNKDVILVSINYRLGAFGYFSHPDLENHEDGFNGGSAGNYGLLDQVQALQWVKNNIQNFGGDPDNITIFGESAGGWSVFNLLTTPASEGLFHKAIVQSGGSETAHDTEKAFKIGKRISKSLGCEDTSNAATCLRNQSAETILKKSLTANARCMMTFRIETGFCFIPRIDGTVLPDLPLETIEAGNHHKVPLIAGYTSKDPWFLRNSTVGTAKEMEGDQDIWIYKFKFKKNFMNFFSSGVHGTDLPVVFDTMTDFKVFHNKIAFFKEKHAQRAERLVEEMQHYWTNFAKYGNPNGETPDSGFLDWPQHHGKYLMYLTNESSLLED